MEPKQDNHETLSSDRPKTLSPLSVWALSFGCIIGWGSVIMPGTSFLPNAGPLGTIIAILIGAMCFVFVSRSFGYMIGKMPENGGVFTYVLRVLDRPHAFLAAWALGFAYIALLWVNANTYVLCTRFFFGDILQWGFHYQIGDYDIFGGEVLAGMTAIVLFGLLVAFGRKITTIIQSILALGLLGTVLTLFIGTISGAGLSAAFTPPFAPTDRIVPIQIYHIFLLTPWMFIGFEAISNASGEFKFSPQKAKIIMPLAVFSAVFIYVAYVIIAASALPPGYATNAEYIANLGNLSGPEAFPVMYAISSQMGQTGISILILAVFCALSTSMIGWYRALSNLLKSMADSSLLPARYTQLTSDGMPRRAVFLIMVASLAVPLIGRTAAGWLTDATAIAATISFAYTAICCYKCAKRENDNKMKKAGLVGFVISIMVFLLPVLTAMFMGNVFAIESYVLLAIWAIVGYILTVMISKV